MKKTALFALVGIGILILASAFTNNHSIPNEQETNNPSPSVFKIMEVTYLWDLLKGGYEPDGERDHTTMDVGFRAKYAKAKKYASLELLENAFNQKVFLRGPHGKDMDFTSTTSFGYYNPEFVAALHEAVAEALKVSIFKNVAKKVYTENLKGMANTYLKSYKFMQDNPQLLAELKSEYLAAIASPQGTTGGSYEEKFWQYDLKGENLYESSSSPAFWMRRSIDGTDTAFANLLKMVVKELESK